MITPRTRRSVNTHAGNDKGVYDVARPAKIPLKKAMGIMSDDEIRKLSQPIISKSKRSKPK